jgi:ATP-dependent RNA helicase DeaD
MNEFNDLKLSDALAKIIKELKFENPTEIQSKAIPLALEGKDVIGGSATGSGKTLAFGAPIITHLKNGLGIQALIMTPTRELAEQVCMALRKFSKYNYLDVISVYGGVGYNQQMKQLKTADVVVGTPGRLLDHIGRGTINLSNVKILVLDEADRMLDMGFIDDVTRIIQACPKKRQTLLFSATISKDISLIAKKYMNNPVNVSAQSFVDPSKLKQIFYNVNQNMKLSILAHLLKNEKAKLVMVFCNTRDNADFVGKNLKLNGISATVIHGGLGQGRRKHVLGTFNEGRISVLICTDVAARGLDIPDVSHVYNYDIPKTSKEYVHRIGRAARAGKEGTAISILSPRDHDNFRRVIHETGFKILEHEVPKIERANVNIERKEERGPRRDFKREHYGRSYHSDSSSSSSSRRPSWNRR